MDKKKKIIIVSVAAVALLAVLGGAFYLSKNDSKKNSKETINIQGKIRRPDFGQPDRQPDLRGVVKSIVGNEATILKIDLPTRSTETASSTTGTEKTKVSLAGGEMPGGGRMGGGVGGPPGMESGNTDRADMLAKLKEMSTGEEKVIIPVGVRMMKFDTSGGTREAVEATLADVSSDKNLTVWLAETTNNGTKIAEFVLIN